jgi:ABC-type multidrug transport system fused ATPase/permease subunit
MSNDGKAGDASLLDKALGVAHVAEFAAKLPLGIDTMIGEKGVKLSGGEKQRVGMARAVFKDPELLLLDEATSHLDVESEEKIQDSLHQFFKTVTAVVIAHRLTTIKEMDKIIVVEGGRIIEQGSFAELQAKKGRFYELWEKQKL